MAYSSFSSPMVRFGSVINVVSVTSSSKQVGETSCLRNTLRQRAMKLASGYGPPDPLGAAGAIALQAILILSLTLLFSTRLPSIAGGAIAVVLFLQLRPQGIFKVRSRSLA